MALSEASGREIPYEIAPRRAGDIATCYADPKKANEELGWKAERGISLPDASLNALTTSNTEYPLPVPKL